MDGTTWQLEVNNIAILVGADPVEGALSECKRGHEHRLATGAVCPSCRVAREHAPGPSKKQRFSLGIVALGLLFVGLAALGALAVGVAGEAKPTTMPTTLAPTTVAATPTTPTSSTTITVPYLNLVAALGPEAKSLGNRAIDVNQRWDDRDVSQAEADQLLRQITSDSISLEEAAAALLAPVAWRDSHADLLEHFSAMVDAAEGMVEGLADPNSSRLRRESMDSFVEHATAANGVAVGTAPVSATTTSTTSATTTTTRPPPTTTAPAPTTTWAPVLGWVEGGCVAEVGDDYVELVSCSSRSADWMITQMTFHKDYCPMSSTVFVELELGTVACLE